MITKDPSILSLCLPFDSILKFSPTWPKIIAGYIYPEMYDNAMKETTNYWLAIDVSGFKHSRKYMEDDKRFSLRWNSTEKHQGA